MPGSSFARVLMIIVSVVIVLGLIVSSVASPIGI